MLVSPKKNVKFPYFLALFVAAMTCRKHVKTSYSIYYLLNISVVTVGYIILHNRVPMTQVYKDCISITALVSTDYLMTYTL